MIEIMIEIGSKDIAQIHIEIYQSRFESKDIA